MPTTPFRDPQLNVEPAETLARHQRGEIQLVDIREDYEVQAGRIAGASHIELERLASRASELDPSKPVVFYCRLGARSAMAAQAFRGAGYDAWSMAGGLEAWAEQKLPLVPEGGTVAPH